MSIKNDVKFKMCLRYIYPEHTWGCPSAETNPCIVHREAN